MAEQAQHWPGLESLRMQLARDPEVARRFAAPVPPGDFAAEVGLSLPPVFWAWVALHNGYQEADGEHVHLPEEATWLLSLEGMARWKRFWDDLARQFAAEPTSERRHWAFWHPAWLPIAQDDYSVIALATEPCFGGPAHQIVRFSTDGSHWRVITDSLDGFAAMITLATQWKFESLGLQTLLRVNPDAREVELDPASPTRFDSEGERLGDKYSLERAEAPDTAPSARAIADELVSAGVGTFDEIVERLRLAIESAAVECFSDLRIEASYVDEQIALYAVLAVVEGPTTSGREIALEVARDRLDPATNLGDELMVQIFYLGSEAEVQQLNALQPVPELALGEGFARWRARHAEVLQAARQALLT